MRMKGLSFAFIAAICGLMLFGGAAQAQATRTWVSGVGDDANPCSRTAPCKTFAGAISKTAASGIINCIDAAGFGAVTITKSITIDCRNTNAGIVVSGTNGINIPTANIIVNLRGLDIEGVGTYHFYLKCVRQLGDIKTGDEGSGNAVFVFPTASVGATFAFDMYPEGAPPGNKFQSATVSY